MKLFPGALVIVTTFCLLKSVRVLAQGNSTVLVNVTSPDPYTTVIEGDSVETCVSLDSDDLLGEETVVLNIEFFNYTAVSNVDYILPSQTTLTLTSDTNTSCVTIHTIDDAVSEDLEEFDLIYSVDSSSNIQAAVLISVPNTIIVLIQDEDEVSLGFQQASYSVVEGANALVCVIITSGTLERDFSVSIIPLTGGSANETDYSFPYGPSVYFSSMSIFGVGSGPCWTLEAVEDMVAERNVETVIFTLNPSTSDRVSIDPNAAVITVYIIDADTLRPIDGSGSGSALMPPEITCSETPPTLATEIFAPLSTLIESLSCQSTSPTPLLFILEFADHQMMLTQHTALSFLVADVFKRADNSVNVTVCFQHAGNSLACDEDFLATNLGVLTVSVQPSTGRLFPYGSLTDDKSFRGVLDGAVSIYPSDSVPFYSKYYRRLYVSTNGLVSFDQQYLSWWPVPFPYGRSRIPVVAPFWADFDYRNEMPGSRVFYRVYDRKSSSLLETAVLDEFALRLSDSDFQAQWMLVVTWKDAVPWPYYYYRYFNYLYGGQTTFQLVLATDFIQTHAFFLYEDSTLNLFSWQRVVVGYDTKDFVNYYTVPLPRDDLLELHTLSGNTGRTGEWFFNFTSPPEQTTAEQRCMMWASRQKALDVSFNSSSLRVSSCPCTRRQAWRDWSFWFAYFWGLSSRPNCATVLFSGSQSTIECCYDQFGSLIVGPNEGGSFKLYNPLFFYQENFIEDANPYRDCCVESKRCRLYYMYRPSDDCSAYVPPSPQFTFGDPHFRTVDNQNFTFNGIGEYILINTPSTLGFNMQARLQQFDSNVTGTVMSAVAIKQGDVQTVQIEADNGQMRLYIAGLEYELAATDSPLVVDSTGVVSDDLTGGIGDMGDPMAMAVMADQVFVRMDDDGSLVASTAEGASISFALQSGYLGIVVSLPDSFMNMTSGLLGRFDGNPDDDFRDRNGTVLSLTTQREVYEQFGLEWHASEAESIFNYSIGGSLYSEVNSGYDSHIPVFLEDIIDNVSQEVIDMCQNNMQCVYDAAVSGDMSIGLATLGTSNTNEEIMQTLANTPPSITGDFVLLATAGELVSVTFQVTDPDAGDEVDTFSCLKQVEGFSCTRSGDSLEVTWTNPMAPFPSSVLQVFANDSTGATTVRSISVVLCQCNGGNCSIDNSTLQTAEYNQYGYYQWPCECPDFFGGDSCEVDQRGCGFSVCPDYSVCMNDTDEASGYVCADCQEGFSVNSSIAGSKCMDINECLEGTHNCSQLCTNTEGSYTCSCQEGYVPGNDPMTCDDVDECELGTSNCSQLCDNTEGGFNCSCQSGYSLEDDNRTCSIESCGVLDPCDVLLECATVGTSQFECLCPAGQSCDGVCTSVTLDDLETGTQTCQGCPSDMYGVRCSETCMLCSGNGNCDPMRGCVCFEGWSGLHCDEEINAYAPSFNASTPTTLDITWDLTAGAEIIRIMATDMDVGPDSSSIRYAITDSPHPLPDDVSDGTDIFSIDATSGQITLNADLVNQLGRYTLFEVNVQASDRGRPSLSTSRRLSLSPIPVPRFQSPPSPVTISEELALGTVVSNLVCDEIGLPSNSISFSLSGNGSVFFRIEGTSVAVNRRIDYEALSESEREFTIVATCSNNFNQMASTMLSFTIMNADDNLFLFDSSRYTASVSENATLGDVVQTVTAADRDVPDALVVYSLEPSADAADFAIHQNGNITVQSDLDRETQSLYLLTVNAVYTTTSGSQERASAEVTINIADINDESPMFEQTVYTIRNITTSSKIGDLVLTVTANDEDEGSNGVVTYQLENDSEGRFEINTTTGDIYIASDLTHGLHALVVNGTDGGEMPLSNSAFVYVYVQPSPNRIVLTLAEDPFFVREDVQVGSQIARVFSAVVDDSNVTLNASSDLTVTFEIVNGSDPDRFVISRTTGEIFTLATLDYDMLATEYDLIIRATLKDTELTNETIVRIVLENLNDNPPQFMPTFYASTAEQFTPSNTTIVTVSASDPDGLQTIQYTLSGEDSSVFQIEPTSGEISAVVELDTPQDYRFSVIASDGGQETSTAAVFVSVTRSVTVAPVFTKDEFVFTLSENASPGTFVGQVTAITRGNRSSEEFGHLGFRISMPDPIDFNITSPPVTNVTQDLFHIETETGIIRTQAMFEFDVESRQDYVFYVEVYNVDNETAYANATVQIQLLDENDNPPVFEQSLYTRVINASLARGSVVIQVTASDRDSGTNGQITYALEENMLGFALNTSSGGISVSNSTLLPGDYYLTIIASDGGNETLTARATIYIAVIPVTPESIEFTEQTYNFEVVEDAPPNTLIGTIQALETNSSLTPPDLVYSLPNITTCFSVDLRSGEIRLSCTSLDRDTAPTHELLVRAEANGVVTYGTVVITLLDVNDNAPVFSLDIYTSIINGRFGNTSEILQVMASDLDDGNNGTVRYSLISPTDIFRINATTGELFLMEESVEVGDYRLVVQATDMGIPMTMSSTALVLICVTRAHPQTLQYDNLVFSVTENMPANSLVGNATLTTNTGNVIDPLDFPNNLVFTIIGGDSSDLFFVDSETGQVRTQTQMLDRETAPTHVIEILANFTQFPNIPTPFVLGVFTINVLDLNDNEPTLMDVYDTVIDDDADANQILFNITARDIDSGSNAEVSFSIDVQPSSVFGVRVTDTNLPFTYGEIFVNDTDSLLPDTYRFTLTATDHGVPPQQTTARVDIIVEHAIPEVIYFSNANYTFSLPEEMPAGTPVGNVSILPDTPALNGLVFEITGGSGMGHFFMNSTSGEIRKNSQRIDRERVASFDLRIRAYLPDQDPPLTADADVAIDIIDINDNRPMFTQGVYETIGIDTDELNTSVPLTTSILATDRDQGPNADVVYTIHTITLNQSLNTDPTPVFVLNSSNAQLFPASFNIATGVYLLNISGSDQGTPSLTALTSITVVIQRPAPTFIAFTDPNGYTFTLSEGIGPVNFAQVMLDSIPDYLLEFVSYTSQETDFSVAFSTGEISAGRTFDYEVERVFSFGVTSRLFVPHRVPRIDLRTTVTVTVEIVDVNDNTPYFINFPTAITQYEQRPNMEVVHTIVANDSDSGSNALLRYEILNSDLGDLLTINSADGQIMAAANLDRENPLQGRTHVIMIRVCDSGDVPRCVANTTTFTLLDINDNNPRLSSGFDYRVNERLPPMTDVFSFIGTDPDVGANSTLRFFLTSTDVPFTCDEVSGRVRTTAELDYEMQMSYAITLRLSDMGDPMLSTNYTNITVSVVDLPDNTPQFSQTTYRSDTDPTVLIGDVLYQVQATDADLSNSNDTLRYAITGIQETGNNGNLPELRIEPETGRIIGDSDGSQIFVTEAVFTVQILVYDLSQFNLTNTTTLIITVVPDPLAFTQQTYTANINENSPVGSLVATLPISSLSISSNIDYDFVIVQPVLVPVPGALVTFTSSGNGAPAVSITLANPGTGLDREVIDRYEILVTATRPNEITQATLIVIVEDYNDNPPRFLDANNTVVTIPESVPTPTFVTTSNATDIDIDENARLVFSVVAPPIDFPFEINPETGVIETRGVLNYEEVQSYNITIHVRDSGQPRLENRVTYIINIININDEFPVFAAPAYFGEVYALSPIGDAILHTEVRVTDGDDVNNEQPLTFNIYRANSVQQVDDYRFRVDNRVPYLIRVVSIPAEADNLPSQLLEFRLEVADEGNKVAEVPLYISIFTSNNLGNFHLGAVDLGMLLSCEERSSSMCEFRETVAVLVRQRLEIPERVTFFNNTVQRQDNGYIVGLFGWQGRLDSRANRGELTTSERIDPVQYIPYDEALFRDVADSTDLEFLTFAVNLQEKPTPAITTEPTIAPSPLSLGTIVGVAVGAVVAILMVILIFVIVCVFGRRRNQPKKKKNRRPSDLYERSINRFPHRGRKSKGSSDDIPLHSNGQSDLAYETMYDDDEIVDTAQTMPWFDPKYLASGRDEYDGDTEHTLPRQPGERGEVPFNLRATVDGDARRGRRHSSDESAVGGQSVTEMDQSEYLKGYQSSTPMQPGQRMGEFDMFASPRDPDRPFRPSLEHAQNHWQRNQPQQLQNSRPVNQQQQRPPNQQQQLRPINQNSRTANQLQNSRPSNQQQQLQNSRTSDQLQQLQQSSRANSRQNSRASAVKGPLARK